MRALTPALGRGRCAGPGLHASRTRGSVSASQNSANWGGAGAGTRARNPARPGPYRSWSSWPAPPGNSPGRRNRQAGSGGYCLSGRAGRRARRARIRDGGAYRRRRHPAPDSRTPQAPRGSVSKAVYKTLEEHGSVGLMPSDIVKFCHDRGLNIAPSSVRSTLRRLEDQGKALRIVDKWYLSVKRESYVDEKNNNLQSDNIPTHGSKSSPPEKNVNPFAPVDDEDEIPF